MFTPKKLFGIGCTVIIVSFLLIFSLLLFIIQSCEKMEKENNTTVIRELGKGVKHISDEFNKGYKTDTIVVDSTQMN